MLSHYVAREPFQTESIAETLGEGIGIDLPRRSARRQSGLQFASSIIETGLILCTRVHRTEYVQCTYGLVASAPLALMKLPT